MNKCPTISNITFDKKSLDGIEYIKHINNSIKILELSAVIGHLFNIFGGSSLRGVNNSGVSGLMNLVKDSPYKTVAEKASRAISSEASQTGYFITTANWVYFYKSFDALDEIKRERIWNEAERQLMEHAGKPKERLFWQAIANGCKL
ncbi:MAG: hypothetical protein GY787_30575 [Alteromonadales bacterium]|nr:hypothetical protein [Alteromonadales bacterium]